MSVEKTGQKVVDPYYLNVPFSLMGGVDTYDPPVISASLSLLRLENVEGRLGQLISTKGYKQLQNLALAGGDTVVSFGSYQLSSRLYHQLYAFTTTSIFHYNFVTGLFDTPAIFTGFNGSLDPYALFEDFGALYATKLNNPYVKIQGTHAFVDVDDLTGAQIPWCRYGVIAKSHVYMGGFFDGFQNQLAGIRWSDLDDFESFTFNPSASEADFYLLDPDAGEITGVSYQRGQPIVYSRNNIEIGSYIGFPGGFQHQPLFPGLGNIFHNAVVRLKEIDYFIGQDSFYELNGLQVSPIGQYIFEFFINDVVLGPNTSVRGFADTRNYQIFWVYNSISKGQLWAVVYNYIEQSWCTRDPQGLTAWLDTPRNGFQGYKTIAQSTQIINTDVTIINNDPVYPVVLPQFAGTVDINQVSTNPERVDGSPFACVIETFDFYFGNFNFWKEVSRINLEYVGTLAPNLPNLTVSICSRRNQSEPLVYGTPVPVTNIDGTWSFFIRQQGAGKYLRFKFQWNNSISSYITNLTLLSFLRVDHTPDENPEH